MSKWSLWWSMLWISKSICFIIALSILDVWYTADNGVFVTADDPSKYQISSRLAGFDKNQGMHITHNTAYDENRVKSMKSSGYNTKNADFVNKNGELVHRFVVKLKDQLIDSTKREVGLKQTTRNNDDENGKHEHQKEEDEGYDDDDIHYSDHYNVLSKRGGAGVGYSQENGKEKDPSLTLPYAPNVVKESDLDIDYMTAMNKKVQTIAEGHGFRYVKSIGYAPGVYIFERPSSQSDIEHQMGESADIEWYDQLFEPRQRVKRIDEVPHRGRRRLHFDDDDRDRKSADETLSSPSYWKNMKKGVQTMKQRRLFSFSEETGGDDSNLINPEGQYNPYNLDLYFNDPLWSDQWNLADRDVRGDSIRPGFPININVYPAWASGINGAGVIIGIVDDGVQSIHPEMIGSVPGGESSSSSPYSSKYVTDLSWNFNKDTENAEPTPEDKHGTACAGVAAAMANNAKCGIGVAYNSRVANLKILGSSWTSDAEEASALTHACSLRSFYGHYSRFVNNTNSKYAKQTQRKIRKVIVDSSKRIALINNNNNNNNAENTKNSKRGNEEINTVAPSSLNNAVVASPLVSIFSSSWGPVDDGKHWDGPGRLTQDGMKHCTEEGRNGLGSIYIVAGGNGRDNMDSSNYDGYANSLYTMAVAAVGDYGGYTWYSEEGANIICAMPSSGTGDRFIISPDLAGYQGYSSGDCDTKFGGTSAAAPQLAGMVALMLQANSLLTWRDVQHIIVRSSRMTRSNGIKWSVNSAGRHHSMSLGFGVPDVERAVSLARDWRVAEGMETGSSYYHMATGMIYQNKDVPPGTVSSFTWNYTSPFQNQDQDQGMTIRLEHVHVTINANTPLGNGYLGTTLCGPSGVCSILSAEGNGQDKSIEWTFQTLRHWDEPIEYIPQLEKRPPEIYNNFNFDNKKTWTLSVANIYTYRSIPMKVLSWGIDFYGTIMRKPNV